MRRILLVLTLMAFNAFAAGAQTSQPKPRVSVPDINGRATRLVKPSFPTTAVAVGADGMTLTVKVVVNTVGDVLSAMCSVTCHPMLKDAAEIAASSSKFGPLIVKGEAVEYEGFLIYTYVVDRVDWFRFGTAIESTRQFDNLSLGPVAQMLSPKFSKEKETLNALDAEGVDFETRQKGIREALASVTSKIEGDDLWCLDLALALRRVTFWTMAGGRTNRDEMQKAIEELSERIANAPTWVTKESLAGLEALSIYRIPRELPEGHLRQAIMELSRNIRIEPK